MAVNAALSSEAVASVHRWLHTWNTPNLAARTTIEWSPRLTRSLGRCYPERHLIRLASFLNKAPNGLLEEVPCHELAHVVARELHGTRIRPHGPEWKSLMRDAGYEPKTKLPLPANALTRVPGKPRRRYLYIHRCPVCQLSRTAKRAVRRWRCAACLAEGLDGTLTISHRPL